MKKVDSSNNASYSGNLKIKEGDKVKHAKFGVGTVISMEGNFPNIKAVIEFDTVGKKHLLLKYAKLTSLSSTTRIGP